MTVKTTPSRTYRVYAPNEKVAINKFIDLCDKYMRTENDSNKLHWQDQKKVVLQGNYVIYKSEDYCGVREIL